MIDLYLLEPDSIDPRWAPFSGATSMAMLRAGAWRIHERWSRALGATTRGTIAGHLGDSARPSHEVPIADAAGLTGPLWVVDATFCPRLPMRPAGGAKRLLHGGRTIAWRLDPGEHWRGRHDEGDGLVVDGVVLSGAWDLVTALEELLFDDALAGLEGGTDEIPVGSLVIGNPGAVAIRGATVEPGVVFDVQKGAVILEAGATVKSGTRLQGPIWIGEGTTVSGGQLRHTSAGPHCRLHGEIANSVFNGYANKSHDGFLGHSVVGEWVNLGAGTITSNLKNTYGPIRLDVGSTRIETGRSNLGTLFGDHVKTAIGTLLPTGTVLGAGANLFGDPQAAKYVAPFSWGSDDEILDEERFVATARRVMPRRDIEVDPRMEASLRSLHQRSRSIR